MNPIQLFEPVSCTYTYILFDEASRDALIIDPVAEQLQRDLDVLREHGLTLRWAILERHVQREVATADFHAWRAARDQRERDAAILLVAQEAIGIVQAAVACHSGMATFGEAGVSEG